MRAFLRYLLRLVGKSERKVAAVFSFNAATSHRAVVHIREGLPEIPIWLFTTTKPLPETAALCERVYVHRSSLALLVDAEVRLWKCWAVLMVGPWTGGHGRWLVKLAPFLVPPFRALLINKHNDFFDGTPWNVLTYFGRLLHDLFTSGWYRVGDISRGVWYSGPVTRTKDVSRGVWHSGPATRTKDVTRSVSLFLAATVLRWCSYPDRRVFMRLHGSEALRLRPKGRSGTCPTGGEVEFFIQKPGRWDGGEFESFARRSEARWILWQEPGADKAVEDRLPLVTDERTFAVSRQCHYRAWHPMLLSMAPFRKLELGEASQVMAPISSSILVDRAKLLALGIPRVGLPRTAWLLIFWKAAAAGWRSFSVAGSAHVGLQPDLPMHERAFIFNVLANRALRVLGPREADLARGNIAFSAEKQPRKSRLESRLCTLDSVRHERPKVLIVSPFLPYPLAHGGAVRIYNLCRSLADRVDFILAAVREKQDVVNYDKLHEVFREVYIVDVDEPASGGNQLPAQVRERQSLSLRALIADICRTSKPDVLQIEYTHMAAFRDSAPELPAVLVEHDITFTLYRQLVQAKPGKAAQDEYERWLEFEKAWLGKYDGVWTVSEEDREIAMREGGRGAEHTFNIPNGVDVERFVPGDEGGAAKEIFYVGSFRHLPNIIGFEKLCREVMPQVWSKLPDVKLRVVAGPDHRHFWTKLGRKGSPEGLDRRIEIHGFVEDLRPLYAKASVVVAPLEVSAGTNIKVLEAMACGKAIVSTPVGCAGLGLEDGCDILIRKDGTEFARAVCDVLSDAALRRRLGEQARRTAVGSFSWKAIAERAYQSYCMLAGVRIEE